MTERPARPTLCIIIPCYNEEAVLPHLFNSIRALDLGVPFRTLFINDGSRDGTFELLKEVCVQDNRMACLSFSRNFGHQTAVTAGLQHAPGDIMVILDADLQDPPELIPSFIAKWREGYDVVYGVRTNRRESWFWRMGYSLFYRLLDRVTPIHIPRDSGDFALVDRRVVDIINQMPEHNRFVRGLRAWVGFRQISIEYPRPARYAGQTSYNLSRLVKLALDGLTSFSSFPLRLSSWLGAGAVILGLCYLAYTLFITGPPQGWASTMTLVLFLGGLQLIVLGIIGEYIRRIFDEVKGRPHFVLQDRVGWISDPDYPNIDKGSDSDGAKLRTV